MALLAGAAITGAVCSTVYAIITTNRFTDITNRAGRSVVVTVDGEEVTIHARATHSFKVKNATPIIIKVHLPECEEQGVEIKDYSHRDFIVDERLEIIPITGFWNAWKTNIG